MREKKWIALVLVLSLLLAGCGSKAPQPGTITPVEQNSSANGSASQEAVPAEATAPQVETTAPQEQEYVTLGSLAGGIYENSYAGYGCVLDDSWVYKSAEEIQDISDVTQELLEGTAIDPSSSDLYQITDMVAENPEQLLTINVLYQQLTPQERISFAFASEEDVIDAVLEGKDALISSYTQAGIENAVIEKATVDFLGQQRFGIHTTASIQGIGYYILQIFDYSRGEYAVILTAASFIEDNTSGILDLFYAVD